MDTEPFVKVYLAIDKDQTGDITVDEVRNYVEEHGLDEAMPSRWSSLFDPENTGHIKFEKMCDVLGLNEKEVKLVLSQAHASPPPLHPDIIVLSAHMSIENQIKISEEVLRFAQPSESFNPDQTNEHLKFWLDRNLGPAWQVVFVKGSHWITFSYCPENSFQFRLYDYTYLLWRTPRLEVQTEKDWHHRLKSSDTLSPIN